jgi:hypothetical protein
MRFGLLIILCLCLQTAQGVADSARIALLIGNGAYSNDAFALQNPANDVRALDDVLTRLGFEVRAEVDLSSDAMRASLDWFRAQADGADIAVIFYAGHAVQVGSENFLIGTDLAELSSPALVEASITLSELVSVTEALETDLSIIILDACRDNPFSTVGLGRAGLSPVSGGVGTLVAYATDPGNVAADGLGDTSIFTAALLDHVETPGLDVRLMFGRVRQQVVAYSGGQQVPWVEEAVLGEHFLAARPDPRDPEDELEVWRKAVQAETRDSYSAYLDAFPQGLYAVVARLRIDAMQGNAPHADLSERHVPSAAAALQLSGYMVPSPATPGEGAVRQAFARWQSEQPQGARDYASLMAEAGRTATFLGTYTAGILKNDLRRHAAATETLRTAKAKLAIAESDFAKNEKAQPALATMRSQVARIEQIQQGVSADLDTSRTYYDDLILIADRYLGDWISADVQPRFPSSRGITRLSDRALSDAQTFHAHLRLVRTAPDGSYAWLASMMEGI